MISMHCITSYLYTTYCTTRYLFLIVASLATNHVKNCIWLYFAICEIRNGGSITLRKVELPQYKIFISSNEIDVENNANTNSLFVLRWIRISSYTESS